MRTTSTERSPCSLTPDDLNTALRPRPRLTPGMGRTLDRVNACQQARVSGFPGRHCDRVREVGRTMDEPRSVVHRRVWASVRQGGMVMLTGDRGRGKTHLATLVGSEWWAFGFGFSVGPARYWRLSELFADQKAWFDRRRDEWGNAIPEPLEVARTCGLLVLDEIQERQGTDWEQAELVRLLDVRYTEFRPALLITNRTLRDVAAIVGMSAIDRMKEGGAVIECAWDNYRDRIRGGAA